MRTGSKLGAGFAEWKAKNRVSSPAARILSKTGGFIGGALEIIGVIGLIASGAMKEGPDFVPMAGIVLLGIAIDLGSHWIAMTIDKKPSAK